MNMIKLLFLGLVRLSFVFPMALRYSEPFCLEQGGVFRPECTGLNSQASVAIRQVFVGRRSQGMCGWERGLTTDCQTDESSIEAIGTLKYNIISSCDDANACEVTVDPITDPVCDGTAYVQVEYFCFENRQSLIDTGFSITEQHGVATCLQPDDEVLECESGKTILLMELASRAFSSDDCSGNTICQFNSGSQGSLVAVKENCRNQESCPFEVAMTDPQGHILDCSDVSWADVGSVSRFSYSATCEAQFDTVHPQLLPHHFCIGAPDSMQPVFSQGLQPGYKCYSQYVTCQSGASQQGAEECPSDELFDYVTLSCQDRMSTLCSVPTPVNLTATPVSSTQIRIRWEMEQTGDVDSYVVRAEPFHNARAAIQDAGAYTDLETTFKDLDPNSKFTLSVKAVEQNVYESQWTDDVIGYTYPVDPDVSVKETSAASVTFFVTLTSLAADNAKFVQISPVSTDERITQQSGDFEIDGLEPATEYSFQVTYWGIESGLESLNSQTLTAVTKPNAVSNLEAENGNSSDTLSISWNYDGNFDMFRVSVRTPETSNEVFLEETTLETAQVADLIAGQNYLVRVQVTYKEEPSEWTETTGKTYPHRGSISLVERTYSTLEVTWSYEGVATGFEVLIQTVDGQDVETVALGLSVSSLVLENLQPSTMYNVYLTVVSGSLKSLLPRAETGGHFTSPKSPTSSGEATLENSTSDSLMISWNEEPSADTYLITAQETGSDVIVSSFYSNSSRSVSIGQLKPASQYAVHVYSEANEIRSLPLLITGYTLPDPPYDLKVTQASGSRLTLQWKHASGRDDFVLEVLNVDEDVDYSVVTSQTHAEVSGLQVGAEYLFSVWARKWNRRSSQPAQTQFEVPCKLKSDDWNDGKHGKWMIFLIVYSLLTTFLLLLIVAVVCFCCHKYDWETQDFMSRSDMYAVSEDGKRFDVSQKANGGSTRNVYSQNFGPEKSTNIDEETPTKPRPASLTNEYNQINVENDLNMGEDMFYTD